MTPHDGRLELLALAVALLLALPLWWRLDSAILAEARGGAGLETASALTAQLLERP